jgi:hypothetical protein
MYTYTLMKQEWLYCHCDCATVNCFLCCVQHGQVYWGGRQISGCPGLEGAEGMQKSED